MEFSRVKFTWITKFMASLAGIEASVTWTLVMRIGNSLYEREFSYHEKMGSYLQCNTRSHDGLVNTVHFHLHPEFCARKKDSSLCLCKVWGV